MTHELGIQIRDLRLLDPLMTSAYPSAILCRDKALVVNLECPPPPSTLAKDELLHALSPLRGYSSFAILQSHLKIGEDRCLNAGCAVGVADLTMPSDMGKGGGGSKTDSSLWHYAADFTGDNGIPNSKTSDL